MALLLHLKEGWGQTKQALSEQQQIQFDAAFFNGNKEKILGNYDEAINHFKACLYLDDTKAAVFYMLADVYYSKGLMIDAEMFAQKAIQLDGQNIWYQILLAEIYQARKKYNEAGKQHLLLSKRKNEAGHLTEAASLFARGREYKSAIQTLDKLEQVIGVKQTQRGRKPPLH